MLFNVNLSIEYLRGINHLNATLFSHHWASLHDPYYILPLAVALVNYYQIKCSSHP